MSNSGSHSGIMFDMMRLPKYFFNNNIVFHTGIYICIDKRYKSTVTVYGGTQIFEGTRLYSILAYISSTLLSCNEGESDSMARFIIEY